MCRKVVNLKAKLEHPTDGRCPTCVSNCHINLEKDFTHIHIRIHIEGHSDKRKPTDRKTGYMCICTAPSQPPLVGILQSRSNNLMPRSHYTA